MSKDCLKKPVVLVFIRYYLPGYRSGGPVRSMANLVQAMGEMFDFRIVCLNRDHGTTQPYQSIESGHWQTEGNASVYYVAQKDISRVFYKKILEDVQPDMIYLNSLLDRHFSIFPLMLLGRGREVPILLTPRGEFSPGALGLKAFRKSLFLFVTKAFGLYKHIHWHACSKPEYERIHHIFSPEKEKLSLASNLPEVILDRHYPHREKEVGKLRIVIPARISSMKNTDAAIRIVGQLSGKVELELWGLMEDSEYWKTCQKEISLCPSNISVRYRGEVEHEKLHGLLHDYDVMLLPTLGENFGHAIIESLSASLSVIISNRTPWRNLKGSGVGADLSLEDEASFVNELTRYQTMDEHAMQKVREACKSYAYNWYQDNVSLDAYQGMFQKVISCR